MSNMEYEGLLLISAKRSVLERVGARLGCLQEMGALARYDSSIITVREIHGGCRAPKCLFEQMHPLQGFCFP